MERSPVGIDDLNLDGATLALDSAVLAEARGLSKRELERVGFDRRSLIPPYEDAVTLAVNAAMPVVESAGRDAFELLIVATESGLDWGKPLSAYVHRHLNLGSRCRNLEVKHACYGGTAAIQLAAAWVRTGDAAGKRALVVMTDVARRHFDDPGELTAGTGAVAVSVAAEPRVLILEPRSGYASREVYDIARPTAAGEWGDPLLSVAAYLDLLEQAWENYRTASGTTAAVDEQFRYLLFHTPLISLVRVAHRLLLEAERGRFPDHTVDASFDRMVGPTLEFAREVANIYSGSVYVLLAGLLDGASDSDAGTRVGICSYGSGSCAEVFAGRIQETARETVRRHRIGAHLASRVPIDMGGYERIAREIEAILSARDYRPSRNAIPGHFEKMYTDRPRLVLDRIRNYRRHYSWSTDGGSD